MTGSSILEYVHRLDQHELVQKFGLTPSTLMTSSSTDLCFSDDDECTDDSGRTARRSSVHGASAHSCRHAVHAAEGFCVRNTQWARSNSAKSFWLSQNDNTVV